MPLRIYHESVEFVWNGLMGQGMHHVGGNRVQHAKLMQCTSACGSHTNQPTVIELNVGVGGLAYLSLGD